MKTVLSGALAGLMLAPSVALAHAVVFPKKSTPSAYEKYVLRVPNEKDIPTTRVELRFPSAIRVVSFGEVPGWQLEEMRDSANAIVGAAWTGSLSAERFVEFPFVAVNPPNEVVISWLATQTYSNGERVDWTGPASSERPASTTEISGPARSAGGTISTYLAAAAFLTALVSLGLALRRAS